MSQKWRRSQAWDQTHFPAWAWPARALLHAFSTVTLAVCLLSFVVLYAILASVPIGLLAQIPTYLAYGATILLMIAGVGMLSVVIPGWILRRRHASRAARFSVGLVGLIIALVVGVALWHASLWPRLHYDPVRQTGLMLFADFVNKYDSTTLRRLPGVEMSELEFYSWWPLRIVLLAFVTNMVTATVRRIEFTFENLGVLTVHTGIVMIALGSIYYTGLKKEGDTILFAGTPTPSGDPTIGQQVGVFYDNTRVSLFVDQFKGWEQRPLRSVPRYNEYAVARPDGGPERSLSLPVMPSRTTMVDPDIRFRIVGYAPYADLVEEVRPATPEETAIARRTGEARPIRTVDLFSNIPNADGTTPTGPVHTFRFEPGRPASRVQSLDLLSVEYTSAMSDQRFADLSTPLPQGARNGLVVEVPEFGFKEVYPVERGARIRIGQTGYTIAVSDLAPEPPFPIITPGFEGASSSIAIVRITEPGGDAYDRWVYSRYPEIGQDMLNSVNADGMPARRSADPKIRVSYIDANALNVNLDERSDGTLRAVVRLPSGEVRVTDTVGDRLDLVPGRIAVAIAERWDHAVTFERPVPVPAIEQDRQFIGTHDRAALGVEVSIDLGATASQEEWKTVVWLPFCKYLEIAQDLVRRVDLPDGRSLNLAFGRLRHPLPGFELRLIDFQMIAYDHRGSPRDYQSTVLVSPGLGRTDFDAYTHITKLNAPLLAPFHWDEERPWAANFFGRLRSGLSPHQFKFSQAGWDREMWTQSQQMVDSGQAKRPFVRYTILGVGNNPGIHIIALGSVLMGVGIPWAFYVKPLLVQRKKRNIQKQLADGTYVRPTRTPRNHASNVAQPDSNPVIAAKETAS